MNNSVSAQVVDKIGVASFAAMSSLIIVCIGIGFAAVYTKFAEPTWEEACIQAGGVPVQLAKQSYDCKKL